MIVNHNIPALNANRQLGINNNNISKSLEKLSSGLAINRAADNAAGLAISEKMRGQISGLDQATANAEDGISLVQTAEGALNETASILQRMRELSVQSANGTYQDEVDRDNIQKEITALKSEVDRISTSTNYNNINLLDGSLSGGSTTAGNVITSGSIKEYDAAELAGNDLSAADGSTIAAWNSAADTAGDAGISTITIDGKDVKVDWAKYITDSADRAALTTDFSTTGIAADGGASVAKILEDAINAAIDDSGTGVDHVSVSVDATTHALEVKSGLSGSAESEITFQAEGTNVANTSIGNIFFGAEAVAVGTTSNVTNVATGQSSDITTAATDKFYTIIDGNKIEIDGPVIEAGGTPPTTMAEAADLLQTAIRSAVTKYNTAAGASVNVDDITVECSENGGFKITNKTGLDISFANTETAKGASKLGLTSATGSSSGAGLTFQIGANGTEDQRVSVEVADQSSVGLGISKVDCSTQDGANAAIGVIDDAINSVSGTRADLGALQNRMEHTINSLGVASENLTAAESRIRDTDMASEMMEFTKNQILSQASQAMLAQANQLPQGVLQLLQ